MKKRELERQLKRELQAATPDVLASVLAAPRAAEEERVNPVPAPRPRRRRAWALSLVGICLAAVLTVGGVLIGMNAKIGGAIRFDNGGALFLDINPSVQLVLDGEGRVSAVTPLNEDARVLLVNRTELVGLTADEAAALVVRYASEQGYIRVDRRTNAVLVSAALSDGDSARRLEKKVGDSIQRQFEEKGIFGVVVTDAKSRSVGEQAERLGVTESKMRLILSARELGVELSDERAANISISDLYELIEDRAKELSKQYDSDALEEELEALEEQSEEQLEALSERVEELIEELSEYIEDNGGSKELEKALEKLEDALEELLDEDTQEDAQANLAYVYERIADLAGIPADENIRGKLEAVIGEVEAALAAYDTLTAGMEEAYRLLAEQTVRATAYAGQYRAHEKSKDFEKEYKKWLKDVKRQYEEDWDAMAEQWEREEDD